MSISKDRNRIFSVGSDSALKMYSVQTKEQLRSFVIGDLALSSCALSADEKNILIGSWNNNIYSYSIDFGRIIETLPAHDDAVSCLRLKGQSLVSGSWDTTFKCWKYGPSGIVKMPVCDFVEMEAQVKCCDLDAFETVAVAGGDNGSLMFVDLRSNAVIRKVQAHNDAVNNVEFSPNGSTVVSCGEDKKFKIFQVSNGAEILSINLEDKPSCLSTDGRSLFIAEGRTMKLWDIVQGVEIHSYSPLDSPISCITQNENSFTVVTGCEDGTVVHWKAN